MTTFRLKRSILRADLDGQDVLLNPDTGMYHLVNEAGSILLRAMDEGANLDQAAQRLADECGVDAGSAAHDAETFVEAMLDRGLLEVPVDV